MTAPQRDWSQRFLTLMTAALPAHRSEWGSAMQAELASIEDSNARRQFARSAARAAFGKGLGIHLGFGLAAGLLVTAVAVAASRMQLAHGGPGILEVTVPVPAFLLMLVAATSARQTRSFRFGLQTGALALVASSAALFAVLAIEGTAWMSKHGVFILDGDPPRSVVDTSDIAFNIFATGMWVGHVIFWVLGVLIGSAIGAWTVRKQDSAERSAARTGLPS